MASTPVDFYNHPHPDSDVDFDDAPSPSASSSAGSNGSTLSITLTHSGKPHVFHLPSTATLSDLSLAVEDGLRVPRKSQKYLLPRELGGLVKHPFPEAASSRRLGGAWPAVLVDGAEQPTLAKSKKPIQLVGATSSDLADFERRETAAQAAGERERQRRHRARRAAGQAHHASRHSGPRIAGFGGSNSPATSQNEYTFLSVRPLPHLPHQERSLAYLQRLAADPGIRRAMAAHRFSVGLLTEMDPSAYTEHARDGSGTTRILGLNRNQGEVIELRLRTDAGDGYRDYRTVRKTLCHELAHNVWGAHDANFWDLTKKIEREVEKEEYRAAGVGGRTVGGEARDAREYERERAEEEARWRREVLQGADNGRGYAGSGAAGGFGRHDEEDDASEIHDLGGWTGGEFVLGGNGPTDSVGLSRRDILARAAEERIRRMNMETRPAARGNDQGQGQGNSSSSQGSRH